MRTSQIPAKAALKIRLAKPREAEEIARLHQKAWGIPEKRFSGLLSEVKNILAQPRNRVFVAVLRTPGKKGTNETLVGALQGLGFNGIRTHSDLPKTVPLAEAQAQQPLAGSPTHFLCTKISVPKGHEGAAKRAGIGHSIASELLLGAWLYASHRGVQVVPLTRPQNLREHLEKTAPKWLGRIRSLTFVAHYRRSHLYATYMPDGEKKADYGTQAYADYCRAWTSSGKRGMPSLGSFLTVTGRRHLSPQLGMHFKMDQYVKKFLEDCGLSNPSVGPVDVLRIQHGGRPGDASACGLYVAMGYPDVRNLVRQLKEKKIPNRFGHLLRKNHAAA